MDLVNVGKTEFDVFGRSPGYVGHRNPADSSLLPCYFYRHPHRLHYYYGVRSTNTDIFSRFAVDSPATSLYSSGTGALNVHLVL